MEAPPADTPNAGGGDPLREAQVAGEVRAKRDMLAGRRGEGYLRVLRYGLATAAVTTLIDTTVFLQTRDPAYLVFSLLAGLAAVAVAYAIVALEAGRIDEAVAVPLVYLLLVAPVGPALVASRALVSVVLPFIGMAVAMNYASIRHIRVYGVASWVSGTAVLGLWQWQIVRATGIDVAFAVTNTATAAIILGFAFYALSHYSRRLQSAFDDVQGSAAELAEAHARLREVDAARVRFMNNAAHELKTPITPINIQLHLLKRADLGGDKRAKRSVEILERNFARLQRLVGDILDGARLDAGKLMFQLVPVELSDALQEAVEEYERAAELSGLRLEHHIDPGLLVEADPIRIRQVVDNFLSNALKFTRPGGTVTLDAFATGDQVCVSVRDDGMGIAPQDLERLFHPFTQVHDPMTTVTGGSGLGLYIARGIVERHGGHIFAESKGLGHGASFSFLLPRLASAVPPDDEDAASEDVRPDGPEATGVAAAGDAAMEDGPSETAGPPTGTKRLIPSGDRPA